MSSRLLSACGLLALLGLAYSPVLDAGWIYEDPIPPGWSSWGTVWTSLAYWTAGRGLMTLSLQLTPDPGTAHVANVGVHAVNALLVFLLLRTWLSEPLTWLATGIFLLHPIQTEAVAYVASRGELLAACFALMAALVIRTRLWPLAFIAAIAAVLSKESAIVLVLLLPLVAWHAGVWWRGIVAVAPVLYVGWYKAAALERLITVDPTLTHGVFGYAAMQSAALGRYLLLIVWPEGFTVDHDFDGIPAAVAVGALIALMSLIAALPALLRRAPAAGMCCAWALCALSVRWLVPSHGEYLNEHQLYLAMVGLSGLAAYACHGLLLTCRYARRHSLWGTA